MWRRTLLAVAISTAVLSAQVELRQRYSSGRHGSDVQAVRGLLALREWRMARQESHSGAHVDLGSVPRVDGRQSRADANHPAKAAAADRTAPAGSTRKKIGDLYASCMDTATIASRGIAPLQPDFDSIAAIRTQQDLAKVLTRFQQIASPADGSNLGLVIGAFRLSSTTRSEEPVAGHRADRRARRRRRRRDARSFRYPTATTTSRTIPSRRRFETRF